jgi:hypothetical protein
MSSGEDIEDLIQQLQELQLQQAALLTRLARASLVKTDAQRRSNNVPPDEARELVIGDRIRILNPGIFQTDRGVVIKIGLSRITIQTKSGAKIVQAQKNIVINNE